MGLSPHASSPHDGDSGGGNGNHHHQRHYTALSSSHHWEREHESLQAHQHTGASSSWNPYTARQSSHEYQQFQNSAASSPPDYPISSRASNTRHGENAPFPQQHHQYVQSTGTSQVDYGRQARPGSPVSYPQHPSSEQNSDFQPHHPAGLSPRFLPQHQHTDRRKRKRSIEQSPPSLEHHVSPFLSTFRSSDVFPDPPYLFVLGVGVCRLSIMLHSGSHPPQLLHGRGSNAISVATKSFSAFRDTALCLGSCWPWDFLFILRDTYNFAAFPICCQSCRTRFVSAFSSPAF